MKTFLAVLLLSLSAFAQHSVQVSWGVPAGGGQVTGYNIKRGTVAGGPYVTVGTTTTALTFTDTSTAVQTEGAVFKYVMTATGPGGESANSQEVSATIPFSAPGAPTNPTVVVH